MRCLSSGSSREEVLWEIIIISLSGIDRQKQFPAFNSVMYAFLTKASGLTREIKIS